MTPNEELKKQAVTAPQTAAQPVSKPQAAAQPVSKPQMAATPASKPQTAVPSGAVPAAAVHDELGPLGKPAEDPRYPKGPGADTDPTAYTPPTGTDGTHTPPTSVVEKPTPYGVPTDTSTYDKILALFGDRTNPPEAHDYTQAILDQYNALMGYLPENQDYSQQISDIYDKLNESTLAQLQGSYDQVKRQLDEAALKIPQQYQTQSRALEAQNAQNQRNMNEMLAASGLNTGASGQARLAQNAAYMQGSAGIKQSQAEAQAALERERVAKEQDYQNAITAALKDNDYQRAVALTQELKDFQQRAQQIAQMAMSIGSQQAGAMQSEWNRQAQEAYQLWQAGESLNADQRQALISALYHDQDSALEQAKILASYGDFSGFAQLYGEDAARQMQQLWLAQNPQFAFMTGQMTPEQYYQLTGKNAPGTEPTQTYYAPPAETTTTTTEEEPPLRDIPTGTGGGPSDWVTGTLGSVLGTIGTAVQPTLTMTPILAAKTPEETKAAMDKLTPAQIDAMSPAQMKAIEDKLKKVGLMP